MLVIGTAGVMTGPPRPMQEHVFPLASAGHFPVRNTTVKWFRFYGQCLRHAHKTAWAVIGGISTVTTFAIPIAAQLFGVDQKTVDVLLISSLPIAVIICFIIVPFREAFLLYREKEAALQEEKEKTKKLQDALLEKQKAELSPRTKEHLDKLRKFSARLTNCKQWFWYLPNDEHFLMAMEQIRPLHEEIQSFLQGELPEKLSTYVGELFLPGKTMHATGAEFVDFCARKALALQQIEMEITNST
jgi:hypothetical protein